MTVNEWISNEISNRFKSQSEFARIAGIPLSTLRSILSRDFSGASVENGILICNALGISITNLYDDDFAKRIGSTSKPAAPIYSANEKRLVDLYHELNDEGQEIAIESVESLTFNPKYKKGTATAKNDVKGDLVAG